MERSINTLIALLFIAVGINAQQPFFGDRKFISTDLQDTIEINGSYASGIDSLQINSLWYTRMLTFNDTTSTIATKYDIIGKSLPSGAQGDILFHNGTEWIVLNAGTNGYYLKTQGSGANPIWDEVTGTSPDTIFVLGQNEWVGNNDTIRLIDSANIALDSDSLDSKSASYYLNEDDTVSLVFTRYDYDTLNYVVSEVDPIYANDSSGIVRFTDTTSIIATKYDVVIQDDTIQAESSDTTRVLSHIDFQKGTSIVADSLVFAATQDIAFKSGSDYKYLYVSNNDSINVTSLPDGESMLILEQDGTGHTVKKGINWGDLMGSGTISEEADAVTIIQFFKITLPSGIEIRRHFIISD